MSAWEIFRAMHIAQSCLRSHRNAIYNIFRGNNCAYKYIPRTAQYRRNRQHEHTQKKNKWKFLHNNVAKIKDAMKKWKNKKKDRPTRSSFKSFFSPQLHLVVSLEHIRAHCNQVCWTENFLADGRAPVHECTVKMEDRNCMSLVCVFSGRMMTATTTTTSATQWKIGKCFRYCCYCFLIRNSDRWNETIIFPSALN